MRGVKRLDERNFVTYRRVRGNDVIETFHGTLEQACLHLLNSGYKGKDVQELLQSVQQAKDDVVKAVRRMLENNEHLPPVKEQKPGRKKHES